MPDQPSYRIQYAKPLFDGLASLMTGQGTTIDRRKSQMWLASILDAAQIEAAYRGNWLMRKCIDIPAKDMTREWRNWQGNEDQITALEKEEKRLHVREKVLMALILGRLGGGAIIIGDGNDPDGELDVERIGRGGLKYLYVVSRWQLKVGDPIGDPLNEKFGEPETFELQRTGRDNLVIHHSRVIAFKGLFSGNIGSLRMAASEFWGDSLVAALDEPVKNATTACDEFASLISEAKIDVFKIPGLMQQIGTAEYENRFLKRLELANVGKSNHRALIMDADEEWEQRQLTLAGMADMVRAYMAVVAGASDIPATRLLGKSPDGMNATGDSDQDNYDQMIRSAQENDLRPQIEPIDEALIRSALGTRPPEIHFVFAPLKVLSDVEEAEMENKEADTLSKLITTGLFQEEALEEAFSNRMIESGRWPGYEEARKKALSAAERDPDDDDEAGVTNPPEPGTTGAGGGPGTPATAAG
jgi:uncharacterized protein